jgi:hypothetical protein
VSPVQLGRQLLGRGVQVAAGLLLQWMSLSKEPSYGFGQPPQAQTSCALATVTSAPADGRAAGPRTGSWCCCIRGASAVVRVDRARVVRFLNPYPLAYTTRDLKAEENVSGIRVWRVLPKDLSCARFE